VQYVSRFDVKIHVKNYDTKSIKLKCLLEVIYLTLVKVKVVEKRIVLYDVHKDNVYIFNVTFSLFMLLFVRKPFLYNMQSK